MHVSRLLSWKSLLCAIALLIVLGFIPDSLYSQTQITPSAQNETPTSQSSGSEIIGIPSRRSTTSLPPSITPSRTSPGTAAQPTEGGGVPIDTANLKRPSLITQAVLLSLLSMLPFIIMILTSFLKIVVVLSLLRTALGVQQAPPNQVINGVAFLLSLFIMYPTGIKMYEAAQSTINQRTVPDSILSADSSTYVIEVAAAASEPLREFLKTE